MSKDQTLNPMQLVKKNLTREKTFWRITVLCVMLCVFIQVLMFGLYTGIEAEAQKNPWIFYEANNMIKATYDWTWIVSAASSLMIFLTFIASIMATSAERGKSNHIMRALGIRRRKMFGLIASEALIPGLFAYCLGTAGAIAVGLYCNSSYAPGIEMSILSAPFALTPLFLLPLAAVLISIFLSSQLMTAAIWGTSIEGALRYE